MPELFMDPYQMARALHNKLCDDVAKAQHKIMMQRYLVQMFGDDALPMDDMARGYADVLKTARERNTRHEEIYRDSMATKLATIRELERLFAEHEKEDMAAFASYLRTKYNVQKTPTKAKA